ncbi:LysR family transcriptional regulator [Agrobacterium pusense]|uniref:LysR family transcriptional regulator n=1 Tax=Agrobacterium pusense TaxID=648995 RepID=UPI00156B0A89|nr:LysR family transcriptional regulator [Agrobacterium pusense]QKJ93249.1 LysR family transcriptional regulator [Agrobacterium pusense]
MDRIDLFRVFTRVVECSSFTRAADTLGLPRSTVSAAVLELEARVGARLLHRTTRKVSATQDGLAFYERCQRIVSDVEDTENIFRQTISRPSGRLRIDVPGRIGRLIIAPALPDFLRRFPLIDIELGVTDRAVNLIEESVDCVLRVGALTDSGLIARQIGRLPLINVGSPAYFAVHGKPFAPGDLSQHWAINYASPSTGRIESWEWLENDTVRSMSMRARVTVNSAEAYIACCLAGMGLIQIPAYDVRDHLQNGALVEVMPDYRAQSLPLALLYPHRQHLSHRLQVFIDWLEALLKRELLSDAILLED